MAMLSGQQPVNIQYRVTGIELSIEHSVHHYGQNIYRQHCKSQNLGGLLSLDVHVIYNLSITFWCSPSNSVKYQYQTKD